MIRNIWILLVTLLILVGCFDQATLERNTEVPNQSVVVKDSESVLNELIPVEVVRIVDGDTLIVMFNNGEEESVRLLLIDTPESVHPNKPVEPFGIEASEFAKGVMPVGSTVYLELDEDERDRYERLLAYVWVEDQMLNELLIENGLARVAYVYPPNTRHVNRFYEIERVAKENKVGIWSIENYVTDRGFNAEIAPEIEETKEVIAASCKNPEIKGNHSSSGEYIYHMPGGQYYDRTNPVEMFCTEDEAVEAGYRKSMR